MKITIIGKNLTSLILSKALISKNIDVELFFKANTFTTSNRTIAITTKNLQFLKSFINIPKFLFNEINEISIFTEKSQEKEILNFRDEKNLFSLIKAKKLFNLVEKDLKKKIKYKSVKIKSDKILKKMISDSSERIIINCEKNNYFNKNFFYKKFSKDYASEAFTFIIFHKIIKNNKAVQIFTKYGPLAFLPLSKSETSIVFSVYKKNFFSKKEIFNLIKKYNKKYLIKRFTKVENSDLKFQIVRNYIYKNVLLFGDSLHQIHPLAGQGFNMTIRDLRVLIDEINKLKFLGLPINKNVLKFFEQRSKSYNLLYANGINAIETFFNFDNKFSNNFSNKIPFIINNNKTLKKFFINVANKGLNLF